MDNATDSQTVQGMELPPFASMLMQSLRSVGYSAATALADLIDNSIAAQAKTVRIAVTKSPHPFVAVTDDGNGMDEKTLVDAMRFGAVATPVTLATAPISDASDWDSRPHRSLSVGD